MSNKVIKLKKKKKRYKEEKRARLVPVSPTPCAAQIAASQVCQGGVGSSQPYRLRCPDSGRQVSQGPGSTSAPGLCSKCPQGK